MTTHQLPRSTFANVTSVLALVVALGGGAYATGLGKDSVRSKHIKDGQVRTADVRNDSLTGADIDESTLALPEPPETPEPPAPPASASVHRSPLANGKLTGHGVVVTQLQVTLPEAGFVDVTAAVSLNGVEGSYLVDAYVTRSGVEVARGYWDAGDADGILDMHQAAMGVASVAAGTHTFKLFMLDTGGAGSTYENAQLIVRYFPAGGLA